MYVDNPLCNEALSETSALKLSHSIKPHRYSPAEKMKEEENMNKK
tara:strand:+ start:48 stop:182 length:135 start_codon:yes stop_codon:yes gene_type:complete